MGALAHAGADREAHWSARDVATRMDFVLRCAFAHGTGAIRTHLDSGGKQAAISWPVFDEMRSQWAGRISLQAAAIYAIDMALDEPDLFDALVATVARFGGVLGGVTYLGHAPNERTVAALERVFAAATRHGLDLDFHVDESGDPGARTLETVADVAGRIGFSGQILCGHCCSWALADEDDLPRLIDKMARTRMAIVSLPMCNMYLQDRRPGHTPRWRGVAPLHEFAAAGIPVMVASDNTRDPFYAYGDLDPIELAREATRILHLDHGGPDWAAMIGATPASLMDLDAGRLMPGGAADIVLTRARSLTEFFARPQSDRTVLVEGRAIDTTLPDHRELDALLGGRA
jgi:cytosine deaminase